MQKQPTGLTRCLITQKRSTTTSDRIPNADLARGAVTLEVGGLQVHGICSHRLLYKEVIKL